MGLKAIIEKLDDVAEPLREHYIERDGKFHLDAEENVGGLKSALEREREERRKAKEALAKFEGVDPDLHRKLLSDREKFEAAEAKNKGDWDAREKQLADKYAKDVADKDTRIGRLTAALEARLIDAEATRAIAEAKGVPALLLPHVRAQLKVFEEDGEFISRVVDGKGNPRKDAQDSPLTIADLVAEMKGNEVFGRAFEPSGAGGSGAPQSSSAAANRRTVSARDQQGLNSNLEGIAKGEVVISRK